MAHDIFSGPAPATPDDRRELVQAILAKVPPPHMWRTLPDIEPLLGAVEGILAAQDMNTALTLLQPRRWEALPPVSPLGLLFAWREWQRIIRVLTLLVEHEASITDPLDRLAVRLMLGGAYTLLNDGQHALPHLDNARQLAQEVGDVHSETIALKHTGTTLLYRGDLDQALVIYNQALTIARYNADIENERLLLNNIGVAYNTQNRTRQALVYFEQAWKIAQRGKSPAKEMLHIVNIASALTRLGDYDVAVRFVANVLPRAQQTKQKDVIAGLLWAKAEALRELGRNTDAISTYMQALSLAQSSGVISVECDIMIGLAHLAVTQNDVARAQELIDAVKVLLTTTPMPMRWQAIELVQAATWIVRADPAQAQAIYTNVVHQARTNALVANEGYALLGLARIARNNNDNSGVLAALLQAYRAVCAIEHSVRTQVVAAFRSLAQTWPDFAEALQATTTLDEHIMQSLKAELRQQ